MVRPQFTFSNQAQLSSSSSRTSWFERACWRTGFLQTIISNLLKACELPRIESRSQPLSQTGLSDCQDTPIINSLLPPILGAHHSVGQPSPPSPCRALHFQECQCQSGGRGSEVGCVWEAATKLVPMYRRAADRLCGPIPSSLRTTSSCDEYHYQNHCFLSRNVAYRFRTHPLAAIFIAAGLQSEFSSARCGHFSLVTKVSLGAPPKRRQASHMQCQRRLFHGCTANNCLGSTGGDAD